MVYHDYTCGVLKGSATIWWERLGRANLIAQLVQLAPPISHTPEIDPVISIHSQAASNANNWEAKGRVYTSCTLRTTLYFYCAIETIPMVIASLVPRLSHARTKIEKKGESLGYFVT